MFRQAVSGWGSLKQCKNAHSTGRFFHLAREKVARRGITQENSENVQLRGRLTLTRCTFLDAPVGGLVLGIYCTVKWGENSSVVALLCSLGFFALVLESQTGSLSTARQGEVVQAEGTAAKSRIDPQLTGN